MLYKSKNLTKKFSLVLNVLTLTLMVSTNSMAATCRTNTAALAGAQSGYKYEVNAINSQAEYSRSSSDMIGKCIGGITGVRLDMTFPDLSDIWRQAVDKICRTASNAISEVSNKAISNINNQLYNMMNGINNDKNTGIHLHVNKAPKYYKQDPTLSGNVNYSTLYK
ncbi:hypothetical protein ABLA30_13820 [Xenorhabdus nematophila]|uniref:hypothetical protein n=1 Tax=Xenorhabdus nematophila TaxID=628 RepID=UPI0032B85301